MPDHKPQSRCPACALAAEHLGLAAYAMTRGAKLTGVEMKDGRAIAYHLDVFEPIDALYHEYYANAGTVAPKALIDQAEAILAAAAEEEARATKPAEPSRLLSAPWRPSVSG